MSKVASFVYLLLRIDEFIVKVSKSVEKLNCPRAYDVENRFSVNVA